MRTKESYLDVISRIDQHILELKNLPGKVYGRDQAVMELEMLRTELLAEIKKIKD